MIPGVNLSSRRLAVVVLIGALAFSATASVVLWQRVTRLERELAHGRLDPLGFRVFADARPPATSEPRLVMYGDSRIAAWPALDLPGVAQINRGIAGQSTAQLVLRYARDVSPLRPRVVVVQAGVNDLMALEHLPEERARIVRDCKANLAGLVALARRDGATVVMTTVFPRAIAPSSRGAIDAAIAEVNAFLAGLAAPDVRVVDLTGVLTDREGRLHPEFAVDRLHLSAAGYAAISPVVTAHVRTLSLHALR